MSKVKFVFVVIIVFLISCKEQDTISYYYDTGEIKSEVTINEDSVQHDTTKVYYKNGEIKAKVNYQNGKKFGEAVYYHQNGEIESIYSWKNDTLTGNSLSYNEFGELEEYRYYSLAGNLIYWLSYDGDGNRIDERGIEISTRMIGNQCFEKEKNYHVEFSFAFPPKSKKLAVVYGEVNAETKEFVSLPKEKIYFNNHTIDTLMLNPAKKGIMKWKIEYQIDNSTPKVFYFVNEFPLCP